jgi:Leucine-rich repeat (LRR) protein
MRQLTSLQSMTLQRCDGIPALPEWLGDLSSLKSLDIWGCDGIKSLPACIQQLTKLQKLEIGSNQELKKWCESEQNKAKLAHINIIQVSSLTNCSISNNFSLLVWKRTRTVCFLQLF